MIEQEKIKSIISTFRASSSLEAKDYPTATIEFIIDIIPFDDSNGYIDITTGNREKPAGIAASNSTHLLFLNTDNNYFIRNKSDIKKIIAENFSNLQQVFNASHEISYRLPINLF